MAVAALFLGTPAQISIETAYAAQLPAAAIPEPPPTALVSDPSVVYAPVRKQVVGECNCWEYVRSQIPAFPNTKNLTNNSTPKVGAVAIFDYSGTPHYGLITAITADGFTVKDGNFGGCGIRSHFIEWSNKAIVGFWSK